MAKFINTLRNIAQADKQLGAVLQALKCIPNANEHYGQEIADVAWSKILLEKTIASLMRKQRGGGGSTPDKK